MNLNTRPGHIPKNSGIDLVDNMEDLIAADVTTRPAVLWSRGTLSGDFNSLAIRLGSFFLDTEEKAIFRTLDLSDLKSLHHHNVFKTMTESEYTALSHMISDMTALQTVATPYNMDIRIIPHSDSPNIFHADGIDRILCCYNGPTTEGLVKEPSPMTKSLYLNFPFFVRPFLGESFSFAVHDIWKHAGTHQNNLKPFWHAATRAHKDIPRLLLVANLPSPENGV